jgi:glycosyltransferase involved in cell wall biosynthesis
MVGGGSRTSSSWSAMMASIIAAMEPIHVLGDFREAFAGADLSLIEIARALRERGAEVELWACGVPHPDHVLAGVRPLRLDARGGMPSMAGRGTLVVGGVQLHVPVPLFRVRPRRVVLYSNVPSNDRLYAWIERLRSECGAEPLVWFSSSALRTSAAWEGVVFESQFGLPRLLGIERSPAAVRRAMVVGRISRDAPGKHHPQDASLYRLLAASGIEVRVMGGMSLAGALGDCPGIRLLPEGAMSVPEFLGDLDVFFYRTGAFVEGFGRVVVEAMASGLPVVAGRIGGYADLLVDANGRAQGGILAGSQQEAFDALLELAAHPERRVEMGRKARERARSLYEAATRPEALAFLAGD